MAKNNSKELPWRPPDYKDLQRLIEEVLSYPEVERNIEKLLRHPRFTNEFFSEKYTDKNRKWIGSIFNF